MSDDPAWKKLSQRTLLETPYYNVSLDHLRHPHGRELDYYVIHYRREAAGIVPVDDRGRILMVRQWRHPVQKLCWSVPAGAIEPGEDGPTGANRELREETGYQADSITHLYDYHPVVGTADAAFRLFVGHGVHKVSDYDHDEICDVEWFTRAQVEAMIDAGELCDGLSLTSLLLWLRKG
jgi:ADP-ribose pyrophosphatase